MTSPWRFLLAMQHRFARLVKLSFCQIDLGSAKFSVEQILWIRLSCILLHRCRLPPLFSSVPREKDEEPVRTEQTRPEMATDRTNTTLREHDDVNPSDLSPEHGIPKRHARVTVKYNRKELQKRLDVEKWIDDSLDLLYSGQVSLTRNS